MLENNTAMQGAMGIIHALQGLLTPTSRIVVYDFPLLLVTVVDKFVMGAMATRPPEGL